MPSRSWLTDACESTESKGREPESTTVDIEDGGGEMTDGEGSVPDGRVRQSKPPQIATENEVLPQSTLLSHSSLAI